MIIGTAGHIDHGKTSLVRALTGRDTDRLKEEKARGISIELGYAYLEATPGCVLGFIDVPGHERFVPTMVAGATGIDYALLVIAADDGVMPQTREHLEILRLLGVQRGAVALTKSDRVDLAGLQAARAEVAVLLDGTPFTGAPVFPVSSRTGEGIAALSAHLAAAAGTELQPAAVADEAFRLAIDRVFTLAGIGTIVTGTAFAGAVRVGDMVELAPAGLRARVRSLHAQDRPAEQGLRGQRLALNLVGPDIERSALRRGWWVVTPGFGEASASLDIDLQVGTLAAVSIAAWTPVHVHHGSERRLARLSPLSASLAGTGDRAIAHLQLETPLVAARGDRIIIRDASAQTTIAGARVLDCRPPARGKRKPERRQFLQYLADSQPVAALRQLADRPLQGASLAAWSLNERRSLGAVVADARAEGLVVAAHQGDAFAFTAAAWDALRQLLVDAVSHGLQAEADLAGIERRRLHRMTAPQLPPWVFAEALQAAAAVGAVELRGAFVTRPGFAPTLDGAAAELWARLAPLLAATPYNPPRVRDLARSEALDEEAVRQLLFRQARRGEVYRIALDHFFTADAVAGLAQIVRELAAESPQQSVAAAAFRDRIGGGRKVAIQILECFDRIGYTRRVGDLHLLRTHEPWLAGRPAADAQPATEKR